MATLIREWRHATRSLRAAAGFTLTTVLTLGLAIGACTTIYSSVYSIVLKPLPYPQPDQIVHVWQLNGDAGRNPFSDPNFADLQTQARGFQALAEYRTGTVSAVAGTQPVRVQRAEVSREFLDVFRTRPEIGRPFANDELQVGAAPTVLIAHRFWQQHFAGDRNLEQLRLSVDGLPVTIVGVLPPGMSFPVGTDIWYPRELRAASVYRTAHNWWVVGRLSDDVTLAAARQEATSLAHRLAQQYGETTWMVDVAIVPLREQLVGDVRPMLLMLLASVGLVLLVACSNLANLLLVRIARRRRELAVRAALGARRLEIALPFVAELTLIAAAGIGLGLAVAVAGVRALVAVLPANLPRAAEVELSWPVLLFALGITLLTNVLLYGTSVWRIARPDVIVWLKDGARGAGSGSIGRLRTTLTVVQLAVSLVLLVGAGLLGRSFVLLLAQEPGFRTDGLLTIDLSQPSRDARPSATAEPGQMLPVARVHQRMIERLGTLPGVVTAGGINRFPLGTGYSNGRFLLVPDAMPDDPESMAALMDRANDPDAMIGSADFRVASAGYFRAMNIPLVRGRLFEAADTPDRSHVAVISESLARETWPDRDPIGTRVQFGNMDGDLRVFTIIGIVGDIRERGLDSSSRPSFYAEYRQRPRMTSDFTIVLQTSVAPASLVAAARQAIREIAPEIPPRFRTMKDIIDSSTQTRRLSLTIAGAFAGSALLLAILGVYGVLSYAVASRRHELAVRLALGAQSEDLRRMVLGDAGRLLAIGLLLGAAGTVATTRLLESMLFGVSSMDPMTYAAMAGVVGLSALLASLMPVMRAARIDPIRTLRTE